MANKIAGALCLLLMSVAASAQQSPKKPLVFKGKVVQVDAAGKRVTVDGEAVDGWMGAMTMAYPVTNAEVLKDLKPGDQISATVFEGDVSLHEVALVAAPLKSGGGLGLAELEEMALKNNPTAAQTQANLRSAAALARQAGLYPNPTVGYYGDEIRGGYTNGGKQGGFVSQTIVLGGKLSAARRVAEVQASEAGASSEIQKLRILGSIRMQFYRVLAAQRLVEVRQSLAKLAGDTTQTSLQLANIGQADRPDILQAEVEQQQAKVGVVLAEQALTGTWRGLAAIAGKPELPLTRLDGDLDAIPEMAYEEWVANALCDVLEGKMAELGVTRASASLNQARKVPVPDLQITGVLAHNNEPLEATRKPTGLQGGVQIGVQLPLFNRNQGNIAAAKGGIESSQQELARVRLQLQRDLAAMFRDYDSARAVVRQYKTEMLPRAEQAYHLYQANYRKMAGAYPQVLISQRTLFQLEAEYVQALESAWQSALAIRGFGLMDGLAAPVK